VGRFGPTPYLSGQEDGWSKACRQNYQIGKIGGVEDPGKIFIKKFINNARQNDRPEKIQLVFFI